MKFRILTALLFVASLFVITPPTQSGAISCTPYILVADGNGGSGHTRIFHSQATTNCNNPYISISNLNNYSATACIGAGGVDQNDWSDCLNSMQMVGAWPQGHMVVAFFDDVNYGGGWYSFVHTPPCTSGWRNLTGHMDKTTSIKVYYTNETYFCT